MSLFETLAYLSVKLTVGVSQLAVLFIINITELHRSIRAVHDESYDLCHMCTQFVQIL